VLHNDTTRTRPFLDLTGKLFDAAGSAGCSACVPSALSERTAGFFSVDFTDPNGDLLIVRYHLLERSRQRDPARPRPCLSSAHPGESITTAANCVLVPDFEGAASA